MVAKKLNFNRDDPNRFSNLPYSLFNFENSNFIWLLNGENQEVPKVKC